MALFFDADAFLDFGGGIGALESLAVKTELFEGGCIPFLVFPGVAFSGPTCSSSSVLPSVVLAYSAAKSPCSSGCVLSKDCVPESWVEPRVRCLDLSIRPWDCC